MRVGIEIDKKWCRGRKSKKKKIEYMCSAWDLTSLKQLIKLGLSHIKIPSACNNNQELLTYLFKNFSGYCHISLGMTTKLEEEEIFNPKTLSPGR